MSKVANTFKSDLQKMFSMVKYMHEKRKEFPNTKECINNEK